MMGRQNVDQASLVLSTRRPAGCAGALGAIPGGPAHVRGCLQRDASCIAVFKVRIA